MHYTWLSAHLFYHQGAEAWLITFFKPFVEKVAAQLHPSVPYFFIRYGEGGRHLRLRLQVLTAYLPVVKAGLEYHAASFVSSLGESDLYQNDYLQFDPYVPEISRYGNTDTIRLAELQFYLSSSYCLDTIASTPVWNESTALATAFQMNITFFYALQADISTLNRICEQFVTGWLKGIAARAKEVSLASLIAHMAGLYQKQSQMLNGSALEVWLALQAGKAPTRLQQWAVLNTAVLRQYLQADISDSQKCYAVRSLLHMNHNRLGVSNYEEPYCMYITHRCLLSIHETNY